MTTLLNGLGPSGPRAGRVDTPLTPVVGASQRPIPACWPRTHTAMHILCGVIYNTWGAAGRLGGANWR